MKARNLRNDLKKRKHINQYNRGFRTNVFKNIATIFSRLCYRLFSIFRDNSYLISMNNVKFSLKLSGEENYNNKCINNNNVLFDNYVCDSSTLYESEQKEELYFPLQYPTLYGLTINAQISDLDEDIDKSIRSSNKMYARNNCTLNIENNNFTLNKSKSLLLNTSTAENSNNNENLTLEKKIKIRSNSKASSVFNEMDDCNSVSLSPQVVPCTSRNNTHSKNVFDNHAKSDSSYDYISDKASIKNSVSDNHASDTEDMQIDICSYDEDENFLHEVMQIYKTNEEEYFTDKEIEHISQSEPSDKLTLEVSKQQNDNYLPTKSEHFDETKDFRNCKIRDSNIDPELLNSMKTYESKNCFKDKSNEILPDHENSKDYVDAVQQFRIHDEVEPRNSDLFPRSGKMFFHFINSTSKENSVSPINEAGLIDENETDEKFGFMLRKNHTESQMHGRMRNDSFEDESSFKTPSSNSTPLPLNTDFRDINDSMTKNIYDKRLKLVEDKELYSGDMAISPEYFELHCISDRIPRNPVHLSRFKYFSKNSDLQSDVFKTKDLDVHGNLFKSAYTFVECKGEIHELNRYIQGKNVRLNRKDNFSINRNKFHTLRNVKLSLTPTPITSNKHKTQYIENKSSDCVSMGNNMCYGKNISNRNKYCKLTSKHKVGAKVSSKSYKSDNNYCHKDLKSKNHRFPQVTKEISKRNTPDFERSNYQNVYPSVESDFIESNTESFFSKNTDIWDSTKKSEKDCFFTLYCSEPDFIRSPTMSFSNNRTSCKNVGDGKEGNVGISLRNKQSCGQTSLQEKAYLKLHSGSKSKQVTRVKSKSHASEFRKIKSKTAYCDTFSSKEGTSCKKYISIKKKERDTKATRNPVSNKHHNYHRNVKSKSALSAAVPFTLDSFDSDTSNSSSGLIDIHEAINKLAKTSRRKSYNVDNSSSVLTPWKFHNSLLVHMKVLRSFQSHSMSKIYSKRQNFNKMQNYFSFTASENMALRDDPATMWQKLKDHLYIVKDDVIHIATLDDLLHKARPKSIENKRKNLTLKQSVRNNNKKSNREQTH